MKRYAYLLKTSMLVEHNTFLPYEQVIFLKELLDKNEIIRLGLLRCEKLDIK